MSDVQPCPTCSVPVRTVTTEGGAHPCCLGDTDQHAWDLLTREPAESPIAARESFEAEGEG